MTAVAVVGASVAYGSQTECFSYGYACTPGYDATNAAGGWAWKYYGGAYAETPTGYHNCTLYAAWRLEQNGLGNPGLWGNAFEWINHTSHNNTPAVGAIAWWGSEVGGGFGHVAYVEQVRGSEVFIRADNYAGSGGYSDAGWIPASSVDAFLHPHDVEGPPKSNGSFVRTPDGSIYVVAGGAALHVDSCAPLGGCPGLIELPNLAGYATEPSNGTFLRVADGASYGLIARVAGGVPLGLDTCEGIPECGSAVNIDSGGYSDYLAAHQIIANGTVVRVADGAENGLIGRVVGGVLLGFTTCEGIPECGSAVNVAENAYNFYAGEYHTIANGTVVRVADGVENGLIGRVVGGVLLGFTTCEGIPECGSAVNVAENAYNFYAGEYHTIANGTVVRVADGAENGLIGRVVGGVLLGFTTCEGIPECSSAVNVAENAYNFYAGEYHTIADGTFVRIADGSLTGLVARAAGGALLGLTSCAPLEECPGFVNIAENAFASYVAEHPEPVNGTIVKGVPSNTYWSFNDGEREPVSASPNAIVIDDGGLSLYAIKTQPANVTTPSVTGQSQTSQPTHGVLGAASHAEPKKLSSLARALARCHKIKNRHRRAKCEASARRHHHVKKKGKR